MDYDGYNPVTEIPDLSAKVVLITGGTAGIGKETILILAAHSPAHIIYTGRNTKASHNLGAECKQSSPSVRLSFVECDLASFTSVQEASKQIKSLTDRLDIFICNAGMTTDAIGLTDSGYELQFGTNYMGHALLTKHLLPLLRSSMTTDPRLVLVSSQAVESLSPSEGICFEALKTDMNIFWLLPGFIRFAHSKLAIHLNARSMAKRYPDITVTAVYPGISYTAAYDNLGWLSRMITYLTNVSRHQTATKCSYSAIWAATASREDVESGVYYKPVGVKGPLTGHMADDAMADKLWEYTQKELEPH